MQQTIIPNTDRDTYVELAARPGVKPKGRLFRKQILKWGSFVHPGNADQKVTVDRDFADKLILNFANGVCDIVQVPIVDDKNRHSEDPTRNLGEVIDIDYDDNGVYAYIDARKHADDLGSTLIGASAMMSLDYTNSLSGEKVGPTLLHVAATNRPYITDLEPYNEVVAAAADTSDEAVVLTSAEDIEEGEPMTKEELIAQLKEEHGIDVAALQTQAESAEDLTQLSNVLGEEGETLTVHDVAEAVLELSAKNDEQKNLITQLSEANEQHLTEKVEGEVDKLIGEGKILPKQRETMVKLARNDRETFDALVPDEAIVSLSEDGVTTHEQSNQDSVSAEVKRIAEEYLAAEKPEK